MNYIYEVAVLQKSKRDFVGTVLGGWQASGIATFQTGLPLTITTSNFDPAGVGFIPALVAGGRPNVICDPNQRRRNTQGQWFNTACFTPNPLQARRTFRIRSRHRRRGMIFGPRTKRVDFKATKNIRFRRNDALAAVRRSVQCFEYDKFPHLELKRNRHHFRSGFSASRDPRAASVRGEIQLLGFRESINFGSRSFKKGVSRFFC